MPRYHFSAIVGHDTDGYWARCPELPGCCTQGDTHEEALDNLREACALYVEDRLACGEDIPGMDTINIISVNIEEAPPADLPAEPVETGDSADGAPDSPRQG